MTRNAVAIVSSIVFVLLALLLVILPVPYVTVRPGQTMNVLGSHEQTPVIRVSGLPVHETSGELRLTTVSTSKSEANVSLPEAVFAYLAKGSDAMPREVVYPPGQSPEEVRQQSVRQMQVSRDDAMVAALRAAGIAVAEMPMVTSVVSSGPAADVLEPGDLINAVNGQSVSTVAEVIELIGELEVGEPADFNLQRDGQVYSMAVVTRASTQGEHRPIVGITVGTGYLYQPTVEYSLDPEIVGPSAGLIFALGIYDTITEGPLTGGSVVAGTGTIDPTGKVGSIGGIWQKIEAANRDGVDTFLVPADNCNDVIGVESEARLVKVDTLRDAIAALQLINEGNNSEVPVCG
ncbi:MAG: S16 family serine protease [Tessaracoccus sp.]